MSRTFQIAGSPNLGWAVLLGIVGLVALPVPMQANPFQRDIAQPGNEAFQNEDYETATSEYLKAQDLEPLSAELHFNLGSAHYRQEEYEQAIESFQAATQADDPTMAGAAHYNLGNARYKSSKRDYEAAVASAGGEGAAGAAVQDYVKKLEECIKDFEETLKRIPEDENAKYNLEMIRREIKNLMRRQPPQDQDQQNQQQQDQEQEQEEQSEQQQSEQQSGQEEEQQEEQSEDSEQQNEQQQQEQQQAQQEEGEEGTPTPEPRPGEGEPTPTPAQAAEMKEGEGQPTPAPTLSISEEMAQNLLDNLPEQRPRARQQRQRKVEKDW